MNSKYFKDLIISYRPNLSPGTLRTYLSVLSSMSKLSNIKLNNEDDILNNIDALVKTFEEKSPIIKKSKLATLIVVLDKKNESHDKHLDKVLAELRKEMFILADKTKEKVQELTPSQKENVISWNEVLDVYKLLEARAKPLMNASHKLNSRELETIQKYVLLSLYVLTEPRRSLDYTSFRIKDVDESHDNFLKIIKKKPYFVFNQYKNASRLGPQQIPIDNKLKLIIQKWSHISPYDYLISANNGNHITSSRISTMLNDIFGKNISSSMLRHIYMTDKFGNVDLEKIKETTNRMGSSNIETMLNYVEKK